MRGWIGGVVSLALAGPLWAQPALVRPTPIEDPSGQSLRHFQDRVECLERGEPVLVRIGVYGDSHIASDLFTGGLRRRLQARYGDGGHGFVLLGSAWPLYRPLDVELGSDREWPTRRLRPRDRVPVLFGLGGAFSTSERPGVRAWVASASSGQVGRSFSRVRIFYGREPAAGALAVWVDGRKVATWTGEDREISVAHGDLELADAPHRVEVEALGPGPVRLYGAILERPGPGFVVDNFGIPALGAQHLAAFEEASFIEQLRERNPDLLIHAFGTNDVRSEGISPTEYRRILDRNLARLKRGAPRASCLVLGPIDRRWRPTDGPWPLSLEQVTSAQRVSARDAGCAFWDQRAAMGGAGSMERWMTASPRVTLPDGVHLSFRGYDLLAQALIDSIHRTRRVRRPPAAAPESRQR